MTEIITAADKLACAEREVLKMRKSVFFRWQEAGKISAGKAAHEIATMEAIVADYREIAARDRLICLWWQNLRESAALGNKSLDCEKLAAENAKLLAAIDECLLLSDGGSGDLAAEMRRRLRIARG